MMEITDLWNDAAGSQRASARYTARWKVMLVFDSAAKKPSFKTTTNDLSLTGLSVQYHSEEKVHTVLNLLLALPPIENTPRKIIRLKAEIISCVPFRGGFRLGMKFIQDAELDKLRQCLDKYVVSDDTLCPDPEAEEFPTLNF